MTTLPQTLATIAMLASTTTAFAASNADLNHDGVVDTGDLLILTSNIGQPCSDECPSDITGDNRIDTADILELMSQWGEVTDEQEIAQSTSDSMSNNDDQEDLDLSWQGKSPVLLDAIYYDQLSRVQERRDLGYELNEGEYAKTWASENNVEVLPYVYNGAVDWYADGEYSDDDKERFKNWIDENIPADYEGPLCLDMEGDWWGVFDTSNQTVMDTVVDFYIEGLEYAQSLRPNAKIGYWGLPKKSHTKDTSITADVSRLLQASTGLFPDVYDMNPIGNGSGRLQRHIETAMEMVNGKVPVYVQASPRYKADNGQFSELHTIDEFMRDQVDAALVAVWTDENGQNHRIQGVALWDAYVYFWWYTENWSMLGNQTRKSMFNELDEYHVAILERMKESVDAYAVQTVASDSQTSDDDSASEQKTTTVIAKTTSSSSTDTTTQNNSSLLVANSQQQSRVIQEVKTTTQVMSTTDAYQSSATSYRVAQRVWKSASRKFASVKTRYPKGSKQYKKALEEYREARNNMRAQSSSYRSTRSTYSAARAQQNSANATFSQSNSTAMLSSN